MGAGPHRTSWRTIWQAVGHQPGLLPKGPIQKGLAIRGRTLNMIQYHNVPTHYKWQQQQHLIIRCHLCIITNMIHASHGCQMHALSQGWCRTACQDHGGTLWAGSQTLHSEGEVWECSQSTVMVPLSLSPFMLPCQQQCGGQLEHPGLATKTGWNSNMPHDLHKCADYSKQRNLCFSVAHLHLSVCWRRNDVF